MTQSHGLAAVALMLAFVTAVSVLGAVRHGLKCKPTHCGCPFPVLWVTGKALNGHVYTDATFWHGHNKVVGATTGHCPPFQKLPGWKRRVLRNGPLLLPGALLASWLLTMTGLAVVAACWAALRYTGRGRRALERLRHPLVMFSRVQDMAMSLSGVAGASAAVVQRGLEWNRDYATAEPGAHVLTWHPPRGFKATGGERKSVEELFASRVGFEMVPQWQMASPRPVLTMTRARQMPKLVLLGDVLDQIADLPDDKSAIGFDDHARMVCWDWKNESPHALVNAGSRHGKTELEEGLICQELRRGGDATVVDVKRVSLQGLQGLPGLTLSDNPRDMEAMWNAIVAWGRDLDTRIDARVDDPTVQFRRSLLVIEEVNQFDEMCSDFWENLPEEDPDTEGTIFWKPKRAKKTPAIWKVIKQGVWEGAFVKKNVIIVGQNIEAQTVKGVRNSIGMRLLGGYQPQNWKALVGTSPAPAAPPQKGRWCLINGSTQTWVQAVIADPADANNSAAIWRDYARAGRRMDGTLPVTEAVSGGFTVGSNGTVIAGQRVDNASQNEAVTGGPRGVLVGLAEAVERGFVPGATVQALRMDRYRSDKGDLPPGLQFPEPAAEVTPGQAERFWSGDLAEFNAARRGRGVMP